MTVELGKGLGNIVNKFSPRIQALALVLLFLGCVWVDFRHGDVILFLDYSVSPVLAFCVGIFFYFFLSSIDQTRSNSFFRKVTNLLLDGKVTHTELRNIERETAKINTLNKKTKKQVFKTEKKLLKKKKKDLKLFKLGKI